MSFLKEVLRGIAIGVANIIPGVSGGTMMVSMGIYGDVIGAVTGMPKHFWKSVKFLYLKRRILGREGHLSNERCAELIEEVATQKTKKVYLGHLSKENNYEKLAYETVKISLHNFTLPIEVARRDTVSTVTSVS